MHSFRCLRSGRIRAGNAASPSQARSASGPERPEGLAARDRVMAPERMDPWPRLAVSDTPRTIRSRLASRFPRFQSDCGFLASLEPSLLGAQLGVLSNQTAARRTCGAARVHGARTGSRDGACSCGGWTVATLAAFTGSSAPDGVLEGRNVGSHPAGGDWPCGHALDRSMSPYVRPPPGKRWWCPAHRTCGVFRGLCCLAYISGPARIFSMSTVSRHFPWSQPCSRSRPAVTKPALR